MGIKNTHKMGITGAENHNKRNFASSNGVGRMVNAIFLLEEAEKSWALGKNLGLYADNEDEVIAALVKRKEQRNHDAQVGARKRQRGKKSNSSGP